MANSWGNSWLSSWASSWGSGSIPPIPIVRDTRDDLTPDQWKSYRDRLLALSKASETYLQSKYVQNITDIEELEEEIKTEIIEAKGKEQTKAIVFYNDIREELNIAKSIMNDLIDRLKREEDEIMIVMMAGF